MYVKEYTWKGPIVQLLSGIDGDKSFLLEIVLSSIFNIVYRAARRESLVGKRINRTTQTVKRYELRLCAHKCQPTYVRIVVATIVS